MLNEEIKKENRDCATALVIYWFIYFVVIKLSLEGILQCLTCILELVSGAVIRPATAEDMAKVSS